jgi:redox-sensitive bicupin YhaK (pirin superfamily)
MTGDGWVVRLFLGALRGSTSTVRTHRPLLGAELRVTAGTTLHLPVDPTYELGVLLDSGSLSIEGESLKAHELGYLEPGADTLEIVAAEDCLMLLLGGPPFGEQIVMWWNFIGRDHDEVAGYRAQWQRLIEAGGDDRFSLPADDPLPPLPAPMLPNARMLLRG